MHQNGFDSILEDYWQRSVILNENEPTTPRPKFWPQDWGKKVQTETHVMMLPLDFAEFVIHFPPALQSSSH